MATGMLGLLLMLNLESPSPLLVYAALAYPLYHLISSIALHVRDELHDNGTLRQTMIQTLRRSPSAAVAWHDVSGRVLADLCFFLCRCHR